RDPPVLRRPDARRPAPRGRSGVRGAVRSRGDLRAAREPARGGRIRPRILIVGRTRYELPLSPSLKRKFDALAERLDVRVLASGRGGDGTFELVPTRPLDGARFWAELPMRIAWELRRFRPDAVLALSAYEPGAALAGTRL